MNLKGITNANYDIQMLPCQIVRQPLNRQAQRKRCKADDVIYSCFCTVLHLFNALKTHYITECLSGWVRKRRGGRSVTLVMTEGKPVGE